MSIQPIGASPMSMPSAAQAPQKAQDPQKPATELTTVTTKCDKKHWHDQSCPHTVTTRPAPKEGEPGYYLNEEA